MEKEERRGSRRLSAAMDAGIHPSRSQRIQRATISRSRPFDQPQKPPQQFVEQVKPRLLATRFKVWQR